MRLRPLSEAECYARCYGSRGDESVTVLRAPERAAKESLLAGEQLRALFEERLDTRSPEAEAA
jgi:hypothetical protein